jgi:hypothetical protein
MDITTGKIDLPELLRENTSGEMDLLGFLNQEDASTVEGSSPDEDTIKDIFAEIANLQTTPDNGDQVTVDGTATINQEMSIDEWLNTLVAADESVSTEETPVNLVPSTEAAVTTTTEEPIAATTSEVATTMPVEITPIVTSSIETGTNERALALLRLIQELRETSDTVAATAEA